MAKLNHHYVPRVHIRHFKFNESYSKYLIDRNQIVNTGSSSGIFKKKHLNTAFNTDTHEVDSDFIEVNWALTGIVNLTNISRL